MPKFVQEKFQINPAPYDDEAANHVWKTDAEARAKKNTPGWEGAPGGDFDSRYGTLNALSNSLPPGMDIEDQEYTDQRRFNHSIAGNPPIIGKNAGDVTHDLNTRSARHGFDRKACCATDDMYTREHNDAFYDDPEVDGLRGFVERNNYLDRL